MPVRWREPFGMVMVEALACGTPVIAFREGAASEIVIAGENGMLVSDEAEMARAVEMLGAIDPVRCRASVADRYDVAFTVSGYEQAYRRAIAVPRAREVSRRVRVPGRPVGEHWQQARARGDRRAAISTTGANGAAGVEPVRSSRRARRDRA
jgi:hypothetical protein